MIKNAILSAMLFTLSYTLLIIFFASANLEGQNQKQKNIVAAQKFIYEKSQTADHVIVGSSLAAMLPQKTLPLHIWNLSFSGKSIFDGLEIIERTEEKPRIVMIEMNVVHRKGDKTFIDEIYTPFPFWLKKHIPIFRDQYQPVSVFINLLKYFTTPSNSVVSVSEELIYDDIDNAVVIEDRNEKMYQKMIDESIEEFSQEPPADLMEENFQLLKVMVNKLESQGICVLFFEMPYDPQLCDLEWFVYTRNKYQQFFPKSEYTYIKRPSCAAYVTTDSWHLDNKSAQKYLHYFMDEIEKIKCGQSVSL